MGKYGILKNGKLALLDIQLDGYKLIVYEEIPEFDQSTHYVVQLEPVENEDNIFIGVEVRELEITEEEGMTDEHGTLQ